MKVKYYIVLIIITLFSVNSFGQNAEQRMKEADELYQKNDYFNAATIYTGLYKQGYRSENLLFNAGNAWYKAKDYGYAILFYERARLLDPASEDANYNLQIARSHITDKFEAVPELFFIRWFDFLSLLNSTNQWAAIAATLFIITLVLALMFLFAPLKKLRYASFWIAVVILFFCILSVVFAFRSNKIVNHSNTAIVICNELVGKSAPGDSGKELFVIHSGTKVIVDKRMNDFSEILLPDGNKGWVKGECVERL